jgi:hypothetical protein
MLLICGYAVVTDGVYHIDVLPWTSEEVPAGG